MIKLSQTPEEEKPAATTETAPQEQQKQQGDDSLTVEVNTPEEQQTPDENIVEKLTALGTKYKKWIVIGGIAVAAIVFIIFNLLVTLPAIQKSAANTAFLEGRYLEAESYYETQLAENPDNNFFRERMALIFYKAGKYDDADREFNLLDAAGYLGASTDENSNYFFYKGLSAIRHNKSREAISDFLAAREDGDAHIPSVLGKTMLGLVTQTSKASRFVQEINTLLQTASAREAPSETLLIQLRELDAALVDLYNIYDISYTAELDSNINFPLRNAPELDQPLMVDFSPFRNTYRLARFGNLETLQQVAMAYQILYFLHRLDEENIPQNLIASLVGQFASHVESPANKQSNAFINLLAGNQEAAMGYFQQIAEEMSDIPAFNANFANMLLAGRYNPSNPGDILADTAFVDRLLDLYSKAFLDQESPSFIAMSNFSFLTIISGGDPRLAEKTATEAMEKSNINEASLVTSRVLSNYLTETLLSSDSGLLSLIEQHPDSLLFNLILAQTHIKERNATEAIDIYESLIRQYPNNASTYITLAQLHYFRGFYDLAVATLRQAIAQSDSFRLRIFLAFLLIEQDLMDDARRLLRDMEKSFPKIRWYNWRTTSLMSPVKPRSATHRSPRSSNASTKYPRMRRSREATSYSCWRSNT